MSKFLANEQLRDAISEILREETCRCAVAFWGKDASERLAKNTTRLKLICNLQSGGTNPFEIENLPRSRIKQCDTLHAKVYVGERHAIISSANVSANGLGLEGNEQAHWIEAGVVIEEISEVSKWFEALWDSSRRITDDDLKRAKANWKQRQRSRPTAFSFSEFDADRADLPLLYCVWDAEWELNEEQVLKQLEGDNVQTIKNLIDESLDVESGDREAMKPGTWIVVFWLKEDDLPRRRPSPYWFHTGRLIERSFRYKGERKWRDSVLRTDNSPPLPFSLAEQGVLDAFFETLSTNEFSDLRVETTDGQFYTQRRKMLIRKFWKTCKDRYVNSKSAIARSG